MTSWVLLIVITVLYAGYNLFIKVSSGHVPITATSTIAATLCLQFAAVSTTLVFAFYIFTREGQVFKLTTPAYAWAAMAGVCIGLAEVGYFYLYRSTGDEVPLTANIVVPVIVSGTIAITAVVSYLVFKDAMSSGQILGTLMIFAGIAVLFMNS